jgi:hypothetical protein
MSKDEERQAELARIESCLAILAGGARTYDAVGVQDLWTNDTTDKTRTRLEAKRTFLRKRLGR